MSLNSLMYCLLAALASHHQVTICINIWVMGRQRMAVEEEGNLGVILRASKSFSLKIQIDNCFGKKSPPIHHNGFLNTSATHFEMLLKPLHIYDDDETLNSFNEETFNSLQRLVAKQCQKREDFDFKTFFLRVFFDEKWNLPNQNWLSQKTSAWRAKKLFSLCHCRKKYFKGGKRLPHAKKARFFFFDASTEQQNYIYFMTNCSAFLV